MYVNNNLARADAYKQATRSCLKLQITIPAMNLKQIIYTCLLMLFTGWVHIARAQQKDTAKVTGRVVNYLTQAGLDSVTVELLTQDSTFIDKANIHYQPLQNGMMPGMLETLYTFEGMMKGKYIIRSTRRKFRTEYVPFEMKKTRKVSNDYYIVSGPLIEMKHERKSMMHGVLLEGVEVAATKLKFYQRGDTLVYDADAFNLAEGSMLDALIGQLPGAELKNDGRIYINGRFVESLLLNGRDFFRGDNRIMLDNLPAYMVKNVEVYDKQNDYNKHADPVYTMDVKLKKQYEVGWMANVGTGIGTDGRYLARLFALRFTKQSRVAIFGNLNNMNQNQKPGLDGDWKPSNVQRGLLDTKQFGADYQVYDKHQKWKVEGNAVASFSDAENEVLTHSENFLSGGNTYGQSFSRNTSDNFSIRTDNKFNLILKGKNVQANSNFSPRANYSRSTNRQHLINGSFHSDPEAVASGMALIDSLRSLRHADQLRTMTINRLQQNSLYQSTVWGIGGNYNLNIEDKNNESYYLTTTVNYRNENNRHFNQNLLEYYQSGLPEDLRNNYADDPKLHLDLYADLTTPFYFYAYRTQAKWITIHPGYEFNYRYDKENMSRYRLDRMAEWAVFDENSLGNLPGTNLLETTKDGGNSYDEVGREHRHTPSLTLDIRRYDFGKNDELGLWFRIIAPVEFVRETTNYQRSSLDTSMTRRAILFNPNLRIIFNYDRKKNQGPGKFAPQLTFNYNARQTLPRHTYLLNVRDDYNPLYITRGNADLKKTTTHTMSMEFRKSSDWMRKLLQVSAVFKKVNNAVTMGYVYDRTTGVQQVTPSNIDGNWTGNAEVTLRMPLDKKYKWNFSSVTSGYLNHNVDLIAVAGSKESNRRTVNTLNLGQTLMLSYNFHSKASIGVRGKADWIDADSKATDFNAVSAIDYSYGLSGGAEFPLGIKFMTEMVCYSRRGYNDRAMNDNEWVWNANLSRSFMKGKLTFNLSGFDMLGQLSNVQRAINAQGRTESTYNVMPRYVMLTATFKMSKQPPKKK